MDAGRELDALIAEKVMGWTWKEVEGEQYLYPPRPGDVNIPHYSTDIAAAWQVVEKLAELGMLTSVCWGRSGNHGIIASVDILEGGFNKPIAAHTAPLAICLAALETVKQH